ncbi:hypothetical protein [Streptomyces chartreusis]|uniref:hypothetical protein n=1 Tax=Streptomyces chartreusis TaxID=1969 RepID=UPI00380F204B
MTSNNTPLDLDAIEARANAAEDGWTVLISEADPHRFEIHGDGPTHVAVFGGNPDDAFASYPVRENAVFAAHAREDVPALLAEVRRLRDELAGQRPDILREVADICDEAGANYTAKAFNDHATGAYELMERFQRKANEAEYLATPCDFVACEPGGEPCSTHERLMAHAEGEHELCAPDCGLAPAALPSV